MPPPSMSATAIEANSNQSVGMLTAFLLATIGSHWECPNAGIRGGRSRSLHCSAPGKNDRPEYYGPELWVPRYGGYLAVRQRPCTRDPVVHPRSTARAQDTR